MTKKFLLVFLTSINFIFGSSQLSQINFPHSEMLLMPVHELDAAGVNTPEIRASLEAYHATAPFLQSLDEYQSNPNLYFLRRSKALQNLLDVLGSNPTNHLIINKLRLQAANKKHYIEALPDIRNPLCNKPDTWDFKEKSISIKDSYWHEFLDPLHRYSYEMGVYRRRWMASSIPNYFIYLDSIETDPLLNSFAPQKNQVKYLYSQEEREKHKLSFKDGLAYLNGELFDTRGFKAIRNGVGIAIFVLGIDGYFYVNDHVQFEIHHSTEFAGQDVIGAGEICAFDGKIVAIRNHSGHYQPDEKSLQTCLKMIKEEIGSLDDIETMYRSSRAGFKFIFSADDFLEHGVKALPKASSPSSPLHFAIFQELDEWKVLASLEEHLNQKYLGESPLQTAAKQGNAPWVKFLLSQGADPYDKAENGLTALDLASVAGSLDCIRLLYIATKSAELREKAAFYAIQSGDINAIKLFERRGASFDRYDDKGNSGFHYAASAKKLDSLHYLLSTPLAENLKERNLFGQTPLHYAAAFGCRETIERLLSLGADITDIDADGNTVLHAAILGVNPDTTDYLMDTVPSHILLKANFDGALPLHYATKLMPLESYEKLVRLAPSLDARDIHGETPIFYALNSPRYEPLQNLCILLEMGADASLKNNCGQTILHKAADMERRWISMMTVLTYFNGIDDVDSDGNSLLHLAAASIDADTLQYLLQHTAKEQLFTKNKEGLDVFAVAARYGNPIIISILNNYINVNIKDN